MAAALRALRILLLPSLCSLPTAAVQLNVNAAVEAAPAADRPSRLAFLKTGRCGSSILMHQLVEAACPHGPEYRECYENRWAQEVLYPYDFLHKDTEVLKEAVSQALLPISTCETGSCGWSLCLSCVEPTDVDTMLESDYWKLVADVIIKNDMQVLLMTRRNPVEWSVSQTLAEERGSRMEKSVEFRALRPTSTGPDYDKYQPCTAYTLDGCSEAEKGWVKNQSFALDMDRVQHFVDHHRAVDDMFQKVKKYLRERNEHQRVMWITMEDLQKHRTWEKVYKFAGLPVGEIPEIYDEHDRYVDTISNRQQLQEYAQGMGFTFD